MIYDLSRLESVEFIYLARCRGILWSRVRITWPLFVRDLGELLSDLKLLAGNEMSALVLMLALLIMIIMLPCLDLSYLSHCDFC